MSKDWKKFFANKNNYVLILLLGVLVLVMLMPVGESDRGLFGSTAQSENAFHEEIDSFGVTLDSTQAYCRMLEERMGKLLSEIEGVGKAEVLITMKYSEEKFLEEETLIKTKVPKVEGVMVVAQGAGMGDVDLQISRIVQALLSVEAHKIAIAKMEAP